MNFIILFIICSIVNVILNTLKTILTVKSNKWIAALINALTFGFYTYIIIITASDEIDTFTKMIITAVTNFICVFLVKLIEEKMRKDRLWKIEVTVAKDKTLEMQAAFETANIAYLMHEADAGNNEFIIYSRTQKESLAIKEIINSYGAKYFAQETKLL